MARHLHAYALCALPALLVLTASPVYSQESGSAQWPQWLTDAMAAETRMLRAAKVEIGDGLVKSRLVGKPQGKPQSIEGGWYFGMDIGTNAPLECWVFTAAIDPAAMVESIANALIQATASANGPVTQRGLHFVDAGAYDGSPYLALEWMYGVGESPNVSVGLAKVRLAVHDDVTFACAHNSLGYRETFALAFEQFIREADVFGARDEPYYEEILLQTIGDQPVGIAHSRFALDADGDTQVTMTEATLVPVDNETLAISDTWYVEYSRPDGTLINKHAAQSENGELTMQLSLKRGEDDQWQVAGTLQGKEIKHALPAAAQPVSEFGQMLAIRDLLADPARNGAKLTVWVPAADPTRFIDAEVVLDPGQRKQGFAELTIGPLAIDAQFDASGSLISGRLDAGASQLVMQRIWSRGALAR